ncbi:MAG: dihydrodipicolinate reductase [Chloroflexi bacterium]|nr:dihydrodipicolinate reductase [Chloroflexota bacterium]
MTTPIRAILYGVGPIGAGIGRLAFERGIRLVGAVDADPSKVGRDLGELLGLTQPLGVPVSDDPAAVLGAARADLVFHATSSYLPRVSSQLVPILQAGCSAISTCEELADPWAQHPDLGQELDRVARANRVTLLGTGINPGFLMDTLPIVLSGICQDVTRIEVTRVVDASQRRLPLQQKIGAGLPVEEFERRVAAGTVRHVGLKESAHMIADALGWELDRVVESTGPVIAHELIHGEHLTVSPGHVAGVRQTASGFVAGVERICLQLTMALGAPDPRDEIAIAGVPDVHLLLPGGVHGDVSTAAIVVNCARRVLEAAPGLITMKDLPPACFHDYRRRLPVRDSG